MLSIIPYPMTIRTVAGSAQGGVSVYDPAVDQGETAVEFTITAAERVDFVLKALKSNSYYNIFKDDQLFASRATGSGQEIKFFNYLSALCKFTLSETDALVTGRISGRVANRQGLPIAGAGISNGEHDVFADNNGGYALESQPIGEYEVTASAPGYISSRKIIILTEQGLTVDFILAVAPDKGKSVVYPNPYISGQSAQGLVYFDVLEENSCIRIYTLNGDLITTLEYKGAARKEWNISGMAGGIYLYYIDSPGSKKRGKISIIK